MGESRRCLRVALRHGLACGPGHVADDRLAALAHRDVLNRDLLLPTGPVALERLHLGRESPFELVERACDAIHLGYAFELA